MSRPSLQADINRYQRAFQGSYEGALQHWRILLGAAAAVITLLYAYEFVAGETGWLKLRTLREETRRLTASNEGLERQVNALKEQDRLLSSDSVVLEQIVRENLRLTKPGEILYLFDETPANAGSTSPVVFEDAPVAKPPPKKAEKAG